MHAVIFDIDGTLLQSAEVDDRLYRQAVEAVLGPVVFRPTLNDYERITDSGILAQILVDNSLPTAPDPTAQIKTCFVGALRSYVAHEGPFRQLPGAGKLIADLRASERHAVAIATGGWAESALFKLESAGLAHAGIPVATSNDAMDRVEIMRIAASRLHVELESVTYYGDGPWDKAASEELGWKFVPVGEALGGLDSFEEIHID